MIVLIRFLTSGFGNAAGDIVQVQTTDDENLYYDDDFGRWCYIEKATEGAEFEYVDEDDPEYADYMDFLDGG